MKKILTQPFFHFLLLGAVIFLTNSWVNGKHTNDNEIQINNHIKTTVVNRFKAQWKREPTADELQNLFNDYVKQEVLYREAIALNLDKNDEIIKRRLQQKMESLINDFDNLWNQATEDSIIIYYQNNIANYSTPPYYSFYQIDYHTQAKAQKKREYLNEDTKPDQLKNQGEIDLLPFLNNQKSQKELSAEYGISFSESITSITLNQWSQPIKSGYGYHLVYIHDIQKSMPIPFQKIKENVIADMKYESSIIFKEKFISDLISNYNITYSIYR